MIYRQRDCCKWEEWCWSRDANPNILFTFCFLKQMKLLDQIYAAFSKLIQTKLWAIAPNFKPSQWAFDGQVYFYCFRHFQPIFSCLKVSKMYNLIMIFKFTDISLTSKELNVAYKQFVLTMLFDFSITNHWSKWWKAVSQSSTLLWRVCTCQTEKKEERGRVLELKHLFLISSHTFFFFFTIATSKNVFISHGNRFSSCESSHHFSLKWRRWLYFTLVMTMPRMHGWWKRLTKSQGWKVQTRVLEGHCW